MLMHLSLGVAAKVGGLENCRSRVDLQSLKSHSRAVYADMQIAQSCKSYSRGILQSHTPCSRADCVVVWAMQSAQIMQLSRSRGRAGRQPCISRDRANQAAVQFVRIRPHLRLPAHSPARSLTCCRCR